MIDKPDWQQRYRDGNLPWDTGVPDENLINAVSGTPITACKTLEIGCGTGTNAIWLTKQGFDVTAVDISDEAIKQAEKKAGDAGVACRFLCGDFISDVLHSEQFQFVFDRGCFHSTDFEGRRNVFAESVAAYLAEGGLWLTLTGNADDPPRDTGPPMLSATEIIIAVEKYFKILSLISSVFHVEREPPPGAWVCLMRKRGNN
jgi:SAM-dependent methyltransferase